MNTIMALTVFSFFRIGLWILFAFAVYSLFNFFFFSKMDEKQKTPLDRLSDQAIDTIRNRLSSYQEFTPQLEKEGVVFGLDKRKKELVCSPTNEEGHVAVFGGSGTGKTSAILIPTLERWQGHAFVIDIAGDISSNVHRPLSFIFEPGNPNTAIYDVFHRIDQTKEPLLQDELLSELAYILMPDLIGKDDAANFYNYEGRKILIASLIAFYHQGLDFPEICEKIKTSSYSSLFNEIDKTQNQNAIAYINSFEGTNEKNISGCKQAADRAIEIFYSNYAIAESFGRSKNNQSMIHPEMIEYADIFIKIPESKLSIYSSALKLIVGQFLNFLKERTETKPILLCLDEFASLGQLSITDALRTVRKRHVRILLLTQSVNDIDLIYGFSERKSMMNNFSFKVVLSASDPETQKYFSSLIGYKKGVNVSSTRKGLTGYTDTYTDTKELIIEEAELARLGDELILLTPEGYQRLQKYYYFKHK